jgi:hypothetical protein
LDQLIYRSVAFVKEMSNYESYSLPAKIHNNDCFQRYPRPMFVLCDKCYWCATYLNKTRMPIDNNCPQCNASSNELTSLPIASN